MTGHDFCYDANGNLLEGYNFTQSRSRVLTWTAYNKPRTIVEGGNQLQFWYAADRSRFKQVNEFTGQATIYVDGLYEKETVAGVDTHVHYIAANGKTIAIYKSYDDTTEQTVYLHRDHLSNIVEITDENGSVLESYAYDAWGKRRNASDWSDPGTQLFATSTMRGYTGHEQLDDVSIIHMNGRIYDPELGRMLSADPYAQYTSSAESLNRYSYVLNNPLRYTDPSGFTPSLEEVVVGGEDWRRFRKDIFGPSNRVYVVKYTLWYGWTGAGPAVVAYSVSGGFVSNSFAPNNGQGGASSNVASAAGNYGWLGRSAHWLIGEHPGIARSAYALEGLATDQWESIEAALAEDLGFWEQVALGYRSLAAWQLSAGAAGAPRSRLGLAVMALEVAPTLAGLKVVLRSRRAARLVPSEQARDALGRFLPKTGDEVVPGSLAEQAVWDAVRNKPGWSVIEGRVSVRNAAGDLRVYDGAAVSPRGRVIGLEVKSGSATRTSAQRTFDAGVNTYNPAVGVGDDVGTEVGRALLITR